LARDDFPANFSRASSQGTGTSAEKPAARTDDMGMSFSKGDEVAFTGSKVKQRGADLILARQVVKRNDTFVFRDEKGGPVWDWHH
jgi:hypothetical protein